MTTSPLAGLEPRRVWSSFDALSRIPRPSKAEQRVRDHVLAWAEGHGFGHRLDAAGNVVVSVPASPGREKAPTVVLQGHLDMVCEKRPESRHDFDRDPIELVVDGEWVRAQGTTLGADNGLGVAAALAVASDPAVAHGPLELLFTVDEETGLHGAADLDPTLVGGRLLVNLDTEEDDAVYIGCAGAAGVEAFLPLPREPGAPRRPRWRLAVGGLRGGHSGMDVRENRGNALKVLARLLAAGLDAGVDFGLVALAGGGKANAIPREAWAELELTEAGRDALAAVVARVEAETRAELGQVEPGLELTLAAATSPSPEPIVAAAVRDRWVRWLDAAPNGVIAMSRAVPGLVETSTNLATVACDAREARVLFSCRSSVDASLAGLQRSLASLAGLAGARADRRPGYPGWEPRPGSPLVRRTVAVYAGLFGVEPAVRAVHAGLECGILAGKLPGLDAVSIGPEIRDAHSPDERARIPSVAKLYRWLGALLEGLSAEAGESHAENAVGAATSNVV